VVLSPGGGTGRATCLAIGYGVEKDEDVAWVNSLKGHREATMRCRYRVAARRRIRRSIPAGLQRRLRAEHYSQNHWIQGMLDGKRPAVGECRIILSRGSPFVFSIQKNTKQKNTQTAHQQIRHTRTQIIDCSCLPRRSKGSFRLCALRPDREHPYRARAAPSRTGCGNFDAVFDLLLGPLDNDNNTELTAS
jgi:hypothetical protein